MGDVRTAGVVGMLFLLFPLMSSGVPRHHRTQPPKGELLVEHFRAQGSAGRTWKSISTPKNSLTAGTPGSETGRQVDGEWGGVLSSLADHAQQHPPGTHRELSPKPASPRSGETEAEGVRSRSPGHTACKAQAHSPELTCAPTAHPRAPRRCGPASTGHGGGCLLLPPLQAPAAQRGRLRGKGRKGRTGPHGDVSV